MQAANKLKSVFTRGAGASLGVWQMIPNANVSRALAKSPGVDWVMYTDRAMHDAVPAIAAAGVSPIVRIPDIQASLVKRALDCGAHGVLVPLLRTAQEAKDLVQAAKFPPWGRRGFGSPFAMERFASAPSMTDWRGDVIRQSSTVDVSVAVSTPTGLITPIVTGVEARGLESISSQVKQLAKLARDGKLKPEQYQGGTISISNMGMNPAVDNFTAIINPPQSTILAIGTTQKVAVPVENEDGTTGIEWDEQLKVTGSFDHKVVDGAIGADWLKEFKKVLENPLQLLL
ncbi:hypothetical protein BN1723_003792 [Verticillium longisporum]|uniref:2-oxoacid dehydrogenase acyltransferase catalytic domain-containing protein n=1 Tax=Verticillium longisporum TaxID=100787 RepID=A0A0G4MCU1_VERLO|nr:hypothetical protein BN1723_003792 [Verticillium longisporum]